MGRTDTFINAARLCAPEFHAALSDAARHSGTEGEREAVETAYGAFRRRASPTRSSPAVSAPGDVLSAPDPLERPRNTRAPASNGDCPDDDERADVRAAALARQRACALFATGLGRRVGGPLSDATHRLMSPERGSGPRSAGGKRRGETEANRPAKSLAPRRPLVEEGIPPNRPDPARTLGDHDPELVARRGMSDEAADVDEAETMASTGDASNSFQEIASGSATGLGIDRAEAVGTGGLAAGEDDDEVAEGDWWRQALEDPQAPSARSSERYDLEGGRLGWEAGSDLDRERWGLDGEVRAGSDDLESEDGQLELEDDDQE